MEAQKHLSHKAQVDLGSFYTPEHLVKICFGLIREKVPEYRGYTLVDSSCGYGSFLKEDGFRRVVGVDIDPKALEQAREMCGGRAELVVANSLKEVSREGLGLDPQEKVIIVGNPPYNDTTSIIRQNIKDKSAVEAVDADIRTRDLGISFLLSYDKLRADYICVLHPLSYLIKPANFKLLRNFAKNYKLVDGLIVSSHEFSDTSKAMAFPILIGFYRRDGKGMSYEDVKNYQFAVKDGGKFRLADFDTIAKYVQKYPNKKSLRAKDEPIAKFWTLRDINALRRNRTFIANDTYNTVYVLPEKLAYYCYIDVFKQYAEKMPYFLGNCDVIIDNEEFLKIKDSFVYWSVSTNTVLRRTMKMTEVADAKERIDEYFRKLLRRIGEEYAREI